LLRLRGKLEADVPVAAVKQYRPIHRIAVSLRDTQEEVYVVRGGIQAQTGDRRGRQVREHVFRKERRIANPKYQQRHSN
jgi:hypothetical protein